MIATQQRAVTRTAQTRASGLQKAAPAVLVAGRRVSVAHTVNAKHFAASQRVARKNAVIRAALAGAPAKASGTISFSRIVPTNPVFVAGANV